MPKKTCAPEKFIRCAIHNPGALHRMLHVSKKEPIPDKLLEKIMSMKTGIGVCSHDKWAHCSDNTPSEETSKFGINLTEVLKWLAKFRLLRE